MSHGMRGLVLVALLGLAGCKGGSITVSGTVTYRERVALPRDAVVRVAVYDLTAAEALVGHIGGDQPARPIASVAFGTQGRQVPIPYTLTLGDPGVLDPKHQYTLRVRIESASGELLFINDTRYGVLTNGVLQQDVVVKRVAAP